MKDNDRYTNEEICTLFRRGSSFSILQQLTGKSKNQLENILDEGGYEVKKNLEIREEIKFLHGQGFTNVEISRQVKRNETFVGKVLKEFGLKPNRKRVLPEEEKTEVKPDEDKFYLYSNGVWKELPEEVRKEAVETEDKQEEVMEENKPVVKQEIEPQDLKNMCEEIKEMLPQSIITPRPDHKDTQDAVDTLTPGQYFYLAKLTLELLKTIWEG